MNPPPSTNELESLLHSRDFLRHLARGLALDEHRAEDLVQDACVRALEAPPRQVGTLRRWMERVARNLAINQRVRELARPAVERRAARREAVTVEEERDLELEGVVLDAVRKLRQPYRTAIYLRYYRGLAPRAIARELGVPLATVKTHLRRGLELLREDLDRQHGGSRSTWCAALLVLALPELVPGAAAGSSAAASLIQGFAVMNKTLGVSLAAATLVAIASVAYFSSGGETSDPAAAESSAALAPPSSGDAAAPLSPADVETVARETDAEAARRTAAAATEGWSASAATPASGIFGRVLDEGGRPVAGASVSAQASELGGIFALEDADRSFGEARGSIDTGPDGRFALPVAEDGPLSLIVSASGFGPFRKEVTGYYDLPTDVGDLVLATGVHFAGRVVDSAGKPVAGAKIHTSAEVQSANVIFLGGGADRVVAETGADGRFEVDRHAVGSWTLVVRSADHPDETASGETTHAGERVDDLEIALRDGAVIAGKLVGAPAGARPELWVRAGTLPSEGEAEEHVSFRFMNDESFVPGERTASVSADGSFVLRGLEPAAVYKLCAYDTDEAWGGRAHSKVLEAESGAAGVELPWSTGAAVTLQAVDARTGLPVEDFAVEAGFAFPQPFMRGRERALHHAEGRVRIDDLRVGAKRESATASLAIVAEGYAPWRSEVVVPKDREIDYGVVRLEPVPRVRVTVLDPEGRPIDGARVTIGAAPALAPGAVRSVRRAVSMGPGGLSSSTDDGSRERTGRTDETGTVALSSLPGERARLSVTASRFAPFESETIDLPASGDFEREVVLTHGAVAEVQVVDAAGAPVPGARVQHRESPEGAATPHNAFAFGGAARVTDSEGRVYFRGLRPGMHGFRLDDGESSSFVMRPGGRFEGRVASMSLGGGDSPFTELELAEGETHTVTLSPDASSVLSGTVSEAGTPLMGAELRLLASGSPALPFGGGPSATSDERGDFAFEDVTPGEYELVVTHASRAMPHRQEVEVRAGGDRIDVELDVTILSGRVTDGEGKPVAGARVSAERVRGAGQGRRQEVMMVTMTSSGGGGSVVVGGGDGAEQVETDAEGHYELRGVSAGTSIRVRAEASDYSPAQSEPLELAAFEKRDGIDLVLKTGGSIAVEVFQDGATPQGQLLVRLSRADAPAPGGRPDVKLTDENGRVSFRDLEPGRYNVIATPLGAGPAEQPPQEVIVVAGQESPLRIDLP